MKKPNLDIKPNEITEATKTSMKTRIITGIVGLCIIVPMIILGDWFFAALVLALTIIGFYETVNCGKKAYSFWLYFVTITVGVLLVNWPFLRSVVAGVSSSHAYDYFGSMELSMIIIFLGVSLLFMVVILHQSFTVRDGCYITAMVIIISLGLQSLLFVRYFPSFINHSERSGWFNAFDNFEACELLVYGLLGTFMTDIGAYFVGVFFGKHKINERISPKKTYEGYYGGIVISAAITMTFAFVMSAVGHPILPGIYDLAHWYNIVFMSLLMPFMATLGDFLFSAVKRFYDIKDFGRIMPGHGGVLDRIDSIVFVFSSLALYTSLFYGLTLGEGLRILLV